VEDHPAVGVQNLFQGSRVRRFWGEGVVDAEDGNVPLCAPLLQVELVGLGRLKWNRREKTDRQTLELITALGVFPLARELAWLALLFNRLSLN